MKKPKDYLEPEEINKLLKMPDRRSIKGKRDYAILKLMAETGLRKSEVVSLRRSNIITQNKSYVLVVECLKKRKLKNKNQRIQKAIYREIPVHKELVEAIDRYRQAHGVQEKEQIFFTIQTGSYL